jgi:uncharacterized protein (TIGR00251 family)
MSVLECHPRGVILSVRASPGSRKNTLAGIYHGALKICVTQVPEKGKANKAIIELLSESFGLKKSQIELLTGETSTQKRFLLRDVTAEAVKARLAKL